MYGNISSFGWRDKGQVAPCRTAIPGGRFGEGLSGRDAWLTGIGLPIPALSRLPLENPSA